MDFYPRGNNDRPLEPRGVNKRRRLPNTSGPATRVVAALVLALAILVVFICAVGGSFARPPRGGLNEEFMRRREQGLKAKALLADKLQVKEWAKERMPDMPCAKVYARGVDDVARWAAANPLAPALIKLSSSCKKNMQPLNFTKARAQRWLSAAERKPYGSGAWRSVRTGACDFKEPHYALIKPEIFAEDQLDINCYNYQFFVVRGRVLLVQRYCEASFLPVRTFFGPDLRPDPELEGLKLLTDPRDEISPLPPTATKMREWAERAGRIFWTEHGIEMARIDFFHVPYNPAVPEGAGKAYFNEFTFTPAAFHLPFKRAEDRLLGERARQLMKD